MQSRPVTFLDVFNQWLVCSCIGCVMLLIYLHLLPRMDRLENSVNQNSQQSRETKDRLDSIDQTLKLLLQHMKEPERWNEAKQMMHLKK